MKENKKMRHERSGKKINVHVGLIKETVIK